jgi:SAM-dependent methyltransferase
MGIGSFVRSVMRQAARISWCEPWVVRFYDRKKTLNCWTRRHPFDLAHGTSTSGYIPGFVLRPDEPMDASTTAYGASQPSIIQQALAVIPDASTCAFYDLGCGKGRPLLVASSLPFRALIGVELSPTVAAIARENVRIYARSHAPAAGIRIVAGDVLSEPWLDGDLVLFLYNPFGRDLIQAVVDRIATFIASRRGSCYVVYYNPVWFDVMDACPRLERRWAASLPYAASEIGFGPDEDDTVVVWQDRGNPHPPPDREGAERPLTRLSASRAQLADAVPVAATVP